MCVFGAGMGLDNVHSIGKSLQSCVSISVTYYYIYLVVFLVVSLGSVPIVHVNDRVQPTKCRFS